MVRRRVGPHAAVIRGTIAVLARNVIVTVQLFPLKVIVFIFK
jgi:hypothetical protein